MSWSIEEHIGENRPWPTQITVYKGETSESMAYVSGEVADRLKVENAKLRKYAELYACAAKTGGCDLCPYCDDFEVCKDTEVEPMSEGCALYMDMRELRIEVDG